MRPWLTFPLLFLGLLFLLMPLWVALGDAAVWTWYGFGLFWAIVIGLLARRCLSHHAGAGRRIPGRPRRVPTSPESVIRGALGPDRERRRTEEGWLVGSRAGTSMRDWK